MLDESEIAELYKRYGHALYRRALTLLGDPEDAREIMQETFCQFVNGRSRFAGRSSAFTYLYRIATNLSIDALRRRKTRGEPVQVDERQMPNTALASRLGESTLAASEIASLTLGLDSETLTIAVMAHVDGLTQDEIASSLDLSRRTIGKKLKRFSLHTQDRAGITKTVMVPERQGGQQ
ncbi:MAG: sigma-70 family RNA polymerase sigma factor [Deltaproteobacteria bacterium]|nr:sigma-70 family RNA polymerase sigma factor [Deltaproteobacteria bacterium]